MNFNKHLEIEEGRHAFLSASKYHWVNYDDEKLMAAWGNYSATLHGTRLHKFANDAIQLGIKLPNTKQTLNKYVNDAIGFKMTTEQPLYYSDNCFGTADAIMFKQNHLRIHDLKTGATRASMRQLEVYTALFCLEYRISPATINIELRLYQSDEVLIHEPPPEQILFIMDKIIVFDKQIEKMKAGE